MKNEAADTPVDSDNTRHDGTTPAPVDPAAGTALTVVVTLATVAGAVLRFWPRSSLWLDEALSVNIAALPFGDMVEALRHDGHPPLYYLLLHQWMKLAGDSDWAVRALSGVISVISLPVAYLAGRRLAGRPGAARLGGHRLGLITVGLSATLPYAVRYGAETRMYALVMLLVLTGYLLVDELLRPPDRTSRATGNGSGGGRQGLLFGAATLNTAALLYSHYWSLWLLAAVGLLALLTLWLRRSLEPAGPARRGPLILVAALVCGGLLYVPWLPTMAYQAAHTGTPWGDKFGPVSVLVLTLVDFAGGRFGVAQFFSYFLVVFLVAAALLGIRSRDTGSGSTTEELVVEAGLRRRARSELVLLTLTLAIGWAAATVSGNTFSSRYAAVVFPLFVLAVAAGVAVLRRPVTTTVIVAALCAMGLLGSLGAARGDRTQNGHLADAIATDWAAHGGPAAVIACPDQLGVSLERALGRHQAVAERTGPVIPFPTAGDPDFVDWVDYAARNRAADPARFLELIKDRLQPPTTVYLVSSGQYRTFEGKCEQLAALLGATRPSELLIDMDTTGLDEYASLLVFRPAG